MKLLLVKTVKNWADEMDLAGFAIFTEPEWKEHLKQSKKMFSMIKEDYRMGIGSNQDMYFDGFKDYKKQIQTSPVTPAEAKKLCKTFKIKVNGKDHKPTWEFSQFGVLTLLTPDEISDTIHQESGYPEEGSDESY